MSVQDIYGNNYERNVYLRGEEVEPRVRHRYEWASQFAHGKILDIGCSTGFGTQFLTKNVTYCGLDKDPQIIELAKENFGSGNISFVCEEFTFGAIQKTNWDTIIAFEFLEHLSEGVMVAQFLKKYCKTLLCSVPYNEEPGFWGPHHLLHNLTERNFPGFEYDLNAVESTGLMLMRWENE